jgi:hypothetical protein
MELILRKVEKIFLQDERLFEKEQILNRAWFQFEAADLRAKDALLPCRGGLF